MVRDRREARRVMGVAYARPVAMGDALELLSGFGGRAVLLAGGTDLLVKLRAGALAPEAIIDVKSVREAGGGVTRLDNSVLLGAGTAMTDLVQSGLMQELFPALVEAAARVGSRQIRNRATVAGNLCNASPAADTAPPLLTYGAQVVTATPEGGRVVELGDLFCGPGRTVLGSAELVTGVEVPIPAKGSGSAFGRVTRRRGSDIASVSVSVAIAGERVRIGMGAVGPTPVVVTEERWAFGSAFRSACGSGVRSPAAWEAIVDRVVGAARPISDVRAGKEYRSAMLRVMIERVSKRALLRAGEI